MPRAIRRGVLGRLGPAAALILAACTEAGAPSTGPDPTDLIGLSEERVLARFGVPDGRVRDGAGRPLLLYDQARLEALLAGREPLIQGGTQGMDASLSCFTALALGDGAVQAVESRGAGC